MTTTDHLARCVELAAQAVDAGDEPFGSVLVGADGTALAEERNRINTAADPTAHPEIALARWAAAHLDPDGRAAATMYTSGEHCAMCAGAQAWVGIGRIVYASSSAQLGTWLAELGVAPGPIATLPAQQVAPHVVVEGPVAPYDGQVRDLVRRYFSPRAGA